MKIRANIPRMKRAWELRQEGWTFKNIGNLVGRLDDPTRSISVQQARVLVAKYERHLRRCS